ncbi:MAG: hypothetical protein H2055_01030 [Sphingopyxis sp.]|nr:hypothetical protein [Sphingopyxis sp.]
MMDAGMRELVNTRLRIDCHPADGIGNRAFRQMAMMLMIHCQKLLSDFQLTRLSPGGMIATRLHSDRHSLIYAKITFPSALSDSLLLCCATLTVTGLPWARLPSVRASIAAALRAK